ncbi:MAG: IPT/TIG domain-containing protein [Anaerolineae bacterium]|nr:IPT/TIG domain-containing protein [Gloeobacterales cyanobacterium ES-bin-313]
MIRFFSNHPFAAWTTRFLAILTVFVLAQPVVAQPEWWFQPPVRIAQVTPTIVSFTPLSGPVGLSVTINGTSLGAVNSVTFNGTNATITSISSTQIRATVPAGATTGFIRVTTSGGNFDESSLPFVVTAGAPQIVSFSPTSGPVGTSVTITGANFNGATSVTFNGTTSSFVVDNTAQIRATVPSGATSGQITVTTPTGSATSTDTYTVTAAGSPTISSFSPLSGPVGTPVVITGSNFTSASAVNFNGTTAAFTVNSSTQITATVPSGATTGTISVTTSGGTATSAINFTVTSSTPTITSFSPTSGPIGTQVLISGNNFTGATAVKFNGTNAPAFTVNSDIQISVTVPSGATTGKISIDTPTGTATSQTDFTVSATGAPIITSFSPQSGSPASTVTLTGSNFTGTTLVQFNGVSAGFTVNSATQITTTVPNGSTTGLISVTNASGTGTSPGSFVVTNPTPGVTSFTPTSGPTGTLVTITGSNFTNATDVLFNGASATSYSVVNITQITATVPTTATTGPIGVVNANGTGTSATNFTVTASSTTGLRFYPVSPCRIIDTRNTATPILAPGVQRSFVVNSGGPTFNYSSQGGNSAGCGIPADAKAVFFNFVAVGPTSPGDLQAWQFGSPIPTASVLNYAVVTGLNIANGIILPVCNPSTASCTSDLNVQANQGSTQLVVDVVGYMK